jgi:K+-sensing histidine kinase KdpD
VHGLVTAFLVLLMLQYRAHVIQQQQQQVALALERSQMQVQQERDIRTEQEKLLAMLAHELKTPLATMHMRLDANASGSREIKQAIRDMNGVIERCQQTLQLSDRQLVPQADRLDMVGLVRDAVSACTQPERVRLDMPGHLHLRADRQLCFIVLNNLLENACKYAAPDSPIDVRLFTAQDAHGAAVMQLEISNPLSPGDAPEAQHIFDKYYRSPHARRQAGTGLGLYLVRNLMQVMGGQIDYRPTAEQVRFVLQLPLDTAARS